MYSGGVPFNDVLRSVFRETRTISVHDITSAAETLLRLNSNRLLVTRRTLCFLSAVTDTNGKKEKKTRNPNRRFNSNQYSAWLNYHENTDYCLQTVVSSVEPDSHLAARFLLFLWNQKILYRVKYNLPLDAVFNQMDPILRRIHHVMIILPSTPRSPKWSPYSEDGLLLVSDAV